MKKIFLFIYLVTALLITPEALKARSPSAGLTLLSPAGAKSLALGESLTGAPDDIEALRFNPASLSSLGGGQASLYYLRGNLEDLYSQVLAGSKMRWGGLGLGLHYYDAGDLYSYDTGAERKLTAQKDVAITFGQSFRFHRFSIGVAEKYLMSELVDKKTSAFAADIGVYVPVSARFSAGASFQNFGTRLKYDQRSDRLPLLLRGGFAFQILPNRPVLSWFGDVAYLFGEEEARAGSGVEARFTPLALRLGYLKGRDLDKISVGAGIHFARFSLDYGLGLIDRLDSQHLVTLSARFGAINSW